MFKRILLIMVGVFIIAQFVQPDRTVPVFDPVNDMLVVTNAPADIQQMVIGACYDCHSYKTTYPWYAKVTPVNYIMQDHINEGREVLNFSVWDQYTGSEGAGECAETLQEGEMPPTYYTFMHEHGRLSVADKERLIGWFNANVPGGEGTGEGDEGEKDDH